MAASSRDVPGTNEIVPWQPTTRQSCPSQPCPFCALDVPHDASPAELCEKIKNVTNDTKNDITRVVERYVWFVTAADNCMHRLGSTARLPAAKSLWDLLDWRTNECYKYMTRQLQQRHQNQPRTQTEQADDVVGAAAAATSSSGSSGPTRGTKRQRLGVDYPQWQYKGGKKKTTWQDYDMETNHLLESACWQGLTSIDFVLDEWTYTVNFRTLSQTSHETGTVREVQRVGGESSRPPGYQCRRFVSVS